MVVGFLFNLMCAMVSCDINYAPTIPNPSSSPSNILKDFRTGRFLDFGNEIEWKPTPPIVQTKSGTVEGYFMKVVNGREIYAFEGIPYAEPPLGDKRFRPPVPKRPWSGIRSAKKTGNDCTQLHTLKLNRVIGNENCLFLNVYSPMIPFENYNPKLGVLIFIHGGGFYFGSGSEYGPGFLLQKDVILVTVNYRLGPLGFLSSGDDESPGNWGLKDQALAIKWVSENIASFGGNSSSITLMGQSAGAVCTHLHMMSNQTKHLFHRAVSMSGTAMNFWFDFFKSTTKAYHTPHQARKWAEKLARFMRCPTSTSSEMMNCFRRRNANFLTANIWNLYDILGFPAILFRPVIEPDLPGAFLTNSPEQAYQQDKVAKIPFMVTNTREEADFIVLILKSMGVLRLWMRHLESIVPIIYDYYRIAGDNTTTVTNAIKDFYFTGVSRSDMMKSSGRELSEIGTDRYYNVGTRKTLKWHSPIAPTYAYIFGLKNSKGWTNLFGESKENYGVSHADDLGFIFNSSVYWEAFDRNRDADMMHIMNLVVNLMTNFVTLGEPLYTSDKDGKDYQIWEPVTDPDNPRFLQIDTQVEMISDPVPRERMEFWERLNLNESYPYDYA